MCNLVTYNLVWFVTELFTYIYIYYCTSLSTFSRDFLFIVLPHRKGNEFKLDYRQYKSSLFEPNDIFLDLYVHALCANTL